MSDFLATMAAASQERVDRLLRDKPMLSCVPAPRLRLHRDFDLIAELKPMSPSEGSLGVELDLESQCEAYARGGAAAVSVLTEPTRFGGSLELLERTARQLRPHGIPVMRKDFLVHPIQIDEAAAAGAGGVLLILAMLDAETLTRMLDRATELGLFVLLEAFDSEELAAASALADMRGGRDSSGTPILVGLNCRDLKTLAVHPERFGALGPSLPRRHRCVAESGLELPADAARVSQLGYRLALVGSALMRSVDPGRRVAEMVASGRAAAGLPRIKICGLRTPEAVDAAIDAGADALGFVMVESPRRVISVQARALMAGVPERLATVGVFRTIDSAAVEMALEAGMTWVQGHPTESGLQRAAKSGLRCLAALNDGPELSSQIAALPGPVLIDGPRSGCGESADLARVAALATHRPLVLAGGLSPESVGAAIEWVRPAGVDVSSGVEHRRGEKDVGRIRDFVRIARAALDETAGAAGGEI